jgi:DNA-binding response OmpR family regulator
MRGNTPTVLVVDDEPAIVDGHAARLESEYVVRTAYDGTEALDHLDETVDVVLLDRRMPGLGGEEVLQHIREAGHDCRVAMLTGVEPSFDILDMGFDDYVTKPISKDDLFDVVERLLRRARYDRQLQEFFALASKAAALETDYDADVLTANPEYQSLRADMEQLREELDDALDQLPAQERFAIATRPGAGGDRVSN